MTHSLDGGFKDIKEQLLLIGKNTQCGNSGVPVSLSGPLQYFGCHITINKVLSTS